MPNFRQDSFLAIVIKSDILRLFKPGQTIVNLSDWCFRNSIITSNEGFRMV